MKQFPLSFHQNARPASEAALFAQKHGKYWEMHDLLFQNVKQLTMENFKTFARQLGLDEAALEQSVKSQAFKATIEKDLAEGLKVGVNGTPTLFVNGKRVTVRDFASIKGMIDEALGRTGAPASAAAK